MYAEQRQRKILEVIESTGRVSVSGAAKQFDVTTETIRRDLDHLASRMLVVRVHGGAVAVRTAIAEPDMPTRLATNMAEKSRIGAAAAEFISGRAPTTLLVDAGSTTGAVIPLLPADVGPIITNGIPIAQAAIDRLFEVHILPGQVRAVTHAAVGAETVCALRGLRPEIALLGCNGMGDYGFTTPNLDESEVKKAMTEQAAYRVMLADSSKAGRRQLATFATLDRIDMLITDTGLSDEYVSLFTDKGIEVIQA